MAGVYSRRFVLGDGSVARTFTVPAGQLVVVKYAACVNASAAAQQAVMYIALVPVWIASVPANNAQYATGLHIVVNALEELRLAMTSPQCTGTICGYLLSTV